MLIDAHEVAALQRSFRNHCVGLRRAERGFPALDAPVANERIQEQEPGYKKRLQAALWGKRSDEPVVKSKIGNQSLDVRAIWSSGTGAVGIPL